jgi:RNA-directed DNA polymerase
VNSEPKDAFATDPRIASPGANQAGRAVKAEAESFHLPAEPAVWTEPMRRALEAGAKDRVWFSLYDKVAQPRTLRAAWERVKANHGASGVDRQSVAQFASNAEEYLQTLRTELTRRSFRPQAVRRAFIEKPGGGMRPLGIPTIRDRVVQTALRFALEPIFEAEFHPRSFGFRPGRGCKDALRVVDALLRSGHRFVVDVDLKSYFDTIPHDRLMTALRRKVADGSVLALIEAFLKAGVLDGLTTWTPERGAPQGAVISPLLSNVYLHPLDALMASSGYEMVRYADDFVVLCKTREEAESALERIRVWTVAAGLELHPEKTRVTHVDAPGGFEFLGYHFERGSRWPRKKSVLKVREAVRRRTPRLGGRSLASVITSLNQVLRGWYAYFKHSNETSLRDVDGFVRRRLRSMLLRRVGRRSSRTLDAHKTLPPSLFHDAGLFCLQRARAAHLRALTAR